MQLMVLECLEMEQSTTPHKCPRPGARVKTYGKHVSNEGRIELLLLNCLIAESVVLSCIIDEPVKLFFSLNI